MPNTPQPEGFEKWLKKHRKNCYCGESFDSECMQAAFAAGHAAGREEAARIAETNHFGDWQCHHKIAAAIRGGR